MDKARETLSSNVKKVRQQLGYSQMKLAELCDLSTGYICEIENSMKFPSSVALSKIAAALGLKVHQLFIEDESSVEWNRLALLANIQSELQEKISGDVESIIKKYLK